jgi:hypothetical protein
MKIIMPSIKKLLADLRPMLVTFGVTLAIVLFIGAAIGMLSDQQIQQQSHEAFAASNKHTGCHKCRGASAEWAPVRYSDVIN